MEFCKLEPLSKAVEGVSERRFTAFCSEIVEDGRRIFEEFFEMEPENETTQKAKFRSEFSVIQDGVKSAVIVTGSRVDVMCIVEAGTASPVEGVESLRFEPGNGIESAEFGVIRTDESRADFCKASARFAKNLPGIVRLAVGEAFFWYATSRENAYQKLSALIRTLDLDPAKTSDFHLRINRFVPFQVGPKQIVVNRLTDWTAPAVTVEIKAADVKKTIAFAASVKTDINTAPSDKLEWVDRPELENLTHALFVFSKDIAEHGL